MIFMLTSDAALPACLEQKATTIIHWHGHSERGNAAQLNIVENKVALRPEAAPGTFAALAIRYYGSPQYQSLSTTSRGNYRRVIDGFLEQHGHRQVHQMTREHVDIIIGKMANKRTSLL